MLSDIYLAKGMAPRQMDVHAHATFSCRMAKFFARLRSLFMR